MTDRKVFPHQIAITGELIQTIVETCEAIASKHYRDQSLRKFLRSFIIPATWVIKCFIHHPDLVEKVKRFLTNSCITSKEMV